MAFLAPLVAFFAANAPAIGAASALAGAGTSIGEAIANSGGPPTPATPTPPAPTPPNAQALAQQRAAVAQQTPNVVGATSGLASPSYDALIAQILAGTIGQPGSAAAGASATGQNFSPANAQPTNAVVQGQPIALSDFVNNFTGG
jgi:hypothetical protein